MGLTIDDGGSRISTYTPPPPPPAPPATTTPRPAYVAPEPAYSPFMGPMAPPQPPAGPYALPPGSTLQDTVSGTQAQPFDVTMSQLATAVYGTRGEPPQGWNAVTNADLAAQGVHDPQAWREQFLGGGEQTAAQEFKAEVYTDGLGNYVLSYRGTAEGADDWDNNFAQGLGFETPNGDKFSVTAVNTAVEFERVFGNHPTGESSNLAITGHSQGGGLATVGALASGVPAVTFDASGIHPNTWDRMNIDPQAARNIAEGGQIRAYSLAEDALTQAQDSWVTGLMAPDALGTQIVVNPAARDANNMFTNYGPTEDINNAPLVNTGVEAARNPVTDFVPVIGPVISLGGDVAYAAISHSPNALTAGMIANQPWQPGYQNPSSLGRDLQNLLPDTLKDDYARNTHDLATDIRNVIDTRFAQGNYVQGALNIYGDLAEGFFNSAGDTLDAGIDGVGGWANSLIDGAGQLANRGFDALGNGAQGAFNIAGNVVDGGLDLVGNGAQALGNAGGQTLRDLGNRTGLSGAGDMAGSVVEGGGRLVGRGIDLAGDGIEAGADALGAAANSAIDFVGTGAQRLSDGIGNAANATVDLLGDGVELAADGIGAVAEATYDAAGATAQAVTDGAKAVGDFLNPFN